MLATTVTVVAGVFKFSCSCCPVAVGTRKGTCCPVDSGVARQQIHKNVPCDFFAQP